MYDTTAGGQGVEEERGGGGKGREGSSGEGGGNPMIPCMHKGSWRKTSRGFLDMPTLDAGSFAALTLLG